MADTPQTPPAPPAAPKQRELTPAEVQALARSEDTLHLDPRTLDPNMHYRWVHERPQRVSRLRARGYRFVEEKDGVKTLTGQEERSGAGHIRNGDTILMCVPKQQYEKGRQAVGALARARLSTPKASFRKKAEEGGVEVDDKRDKE